MARTVEDVALMLTAIAGPDPRSPIAIAEPAGMFARSLDRDFQGTRIAWSPSLGGLPGEPAVTQVLQEKISTFSDPGCLVEEAEPSFRDADEIFKVLRAWAFESKFGPLLANHRDKMKETLIWNVEAGQNQTGPQIAWAEKRRTQLYHRVRKFLERYEFLLCPVSQVSPSRLNNPM